MRVLGIDPGTHVTGWAMIASGGNGGRPRYLQSGAIALPRHWPTGARLQALASRLTDPGGLVVIASEQEVDAIFVEDFTFRSQANDSGFATSWSVRALPLAQALGAIRCLPWHITPLVILPAAVKKALGGVPGSSKDAVHRQLRLIVEGLPDTVQQADELDALAVAVAGWSRVDRAVVLA